ncbi:hypothetical protein CEUSTIGMA_g10557.t1 [Chlamydomonas eustigma]|uniref:Uncharacterized protein n=1 Tax=Chlamydomonas eustigma TaxID=1157962 RepID=A0A250XJ68_9CHLO|nr:hypothetical protein CEUSTIGMA_g10557.t1 [Chlamydomonas eustigma]|eukprot:GAX83131.1 hypothetical protein CEUSTIGMA_g10557.t1 [Chlamydomonas eustigma]
MKCEHDQRGNHKLTPQEVRRSLATDVTFAQSPMLFVHHQCLSTTGYLQNTGSKFTGVQKTEYPVTGRGWLVTKQFCLGKELGPTLTSDLEHVSRELKALRHSLKPDEVPSLLRRLSEVWSECQQGFLESAVLSETMPTVYDIITDTIDSLRPQANALVAVELSKLRRSDPSVLIKLAEGARQGLQEVPTPDLADLIVALADNNARPPQGWLGAVMAELQSDRRMGEAAASSGHLVGVLWALVRLGVRPTRAWLAGYLESVQAHHMQEMTPRELSTLSRAFGEILFRPPAPWMRSFLSAVLAKLNACSPQDLSDLAWGLARTGVLMEEEWVQAFMEVTRKRMADLRTSDLAALSSAVAALGLVPSESWMDSLVECSKSCMLQMSARELAEFVPAAVQLQSAARLHKSETLAGSGTHSQLSASESEVPEQFMSADSTHSAASTSYNRLEVEIYGNATQTMEGSPNKEIGNGQQAWARGGIKRWRSGPLMMQREKNDVANGGGAARQSSGRTCLMQLPWCERVLESCRFKLPRFTAQSLPLLMDSLAAAGARPDDAWLSAMADTAGSKADVLSAVDFNQLSTIMVLDFDYLPPDQVRREALAALMAPRVPELQGVLLVDVLDALGRLEVTMHSLPEILNQPVSFEPKFPISMAAAVAHQTPSLSPPAAAHYAASASVSSNKTERPVKPQAVRTLLGASGTIKGGSANQDWQRNVRAWRTAALKGTLAALPELCEHRLGSLLVATIKLELRPPSSWTRAVLSECDARLELFDEDTITPVVWALSIMREDAFGCSPQSVERLIGVAKGLLQNPRRKK